MPKYLTVVVSLVIVLATLYYVNKLKEKELAVTVQKVENLGNFKRQKSCAKHPNFLNKLKIPQPIAIDLSQKQHKGLAFLYGKGLSKFLHLEAWEKFDYFSTYALSPKGDMFLTPMPFISVKKNTFEFQKNIYKLDSNSGKLSIWMTLDEVKAGGNNPFGVIALAYDCDDNSLWVSAIDETDYEHNRGVIYHIDVASKKILQKLEGIDALSLKLIKSEKGKFLLLGNARESALNALEIKKHKLSSELLTLVTLTDNAEHIRKIKIRGKNLLELQTIPFSYTLIAQTSGGEDRKLYNLEWNNINSNWFLQKK